MGTFKAIFYQGKSISPSERKLSEGEKSEKESDRDNDGGKYKTAD
jgi:hypothetical protein